MFSYESTTFQRLQTKKGGCYYKKMKDWKEVFKIKVKCGSMCNMHTI
jgi:hypothetical protein